MASGFKLLGIQASKDATKKWTAEFSNGTRTRHVSFGAKGYADYTITHDKEQRDHYRQRHAKDLKTGDPTKAGFLAYYILWGNSTDMQENIRAYKHRFGL